jgi:hypothetical protein
MSRRASSPADDRRPTISTPMMWLRLCAAPVGSDRSILTLALNTKNRLLRIIEVVGR